MVVRARLPPVQLAARSRPSAGAAALRGRGYEAGTVQLTGRQPYDVRSSRRGTGSLARAQASSAVIVPLPPKGLDQDTSSASAADVRAELARMTEELGVCAALRAPAGSAMLLVQEVERRMPGNPYHNFQHIYDVAQFLYTLLGRSGLAQQARQHGDAVILDPLAIAALWCGCLGHDIDHPGHSKNLEEIVQGPIHAEHAAAAQSPSAGAPGAFTLEWHHSVAALRLVRDDLGLLRELDPSEAERFETLMTAVIAATDLAVHSQLKELFRKTLASRRAERAKKGEADQEDGRGAAMTPEFRTQAMQCMMKCADLANTVRPVACRDAWEDSAFEEFHREGDALVARGAVGKEELPAMCDRSPGKREIASVAFFESLALPTFESLEEFLTADPNLSAEMATECLLLLRARLSLAVQERDQQLRSTPRPRSRAAAAGTLLGAGILAAVLLLWRLPLSHVPGPPGVGVAGAGDPASPAATAAFLGSWVPPLWALICAGLLGFPLITLWEVQRGALSKKIAQPQQIRQDPAAARPAQPLFDIDLGAGLVEFIEGSREEVGSFGRGRRRTIAGSTEDLAQLAAANGAGMGRVSRATVRKKKLHRKLSAPEEALHSGVWDQYNRLNDSRSPTEAFQSEATHEGSCDDSGPDEPEQKGFLVRVATTLRESFPVLALCGVMVGFSVVNKVLFRVVLVSIGRYVHALSSTTNLAYLVYSWGTVFARLLFGSEEQRTRLRKMLSSARQNVRLFASIGVCESIAFTLMPIGTPGLPKALVPVIAQSTLPISMVLNSVLFNRRYTMIQGVGVALIISGILTATAADPQCTSVDDFSSSSELLFSLGVTTLSYFFLVLSLVLKDVAFMVSANEGEKLDLFLLEGLAGLGQGAALLLQWPMNFALLTKLSPPEYMKAVVSAFTDPEGLMPALIFLYWASNILYRLATLRAVQRLSSLTTLLANVLTVPLSALAFCLPLGLPLIGPPDQLSMLLVLGTLVVCLGLMTYNSGWKCGG